MDTEKLQEEHNIDMLLAEIEQLTAENAGLKERYARWAEAIQKYENWKDKNECLTKERDEALELQEQYYQHYLLQRKLTEKALAERDELKERLKGNEGVYEFANKLAQTMLDLKSSHVFFLMQQAFGDETEWSDVEDILNNIITLTAIKKACEVKENNV